MIFSIRYMHIPGVALICALGLLSPQTVQAGSSLSFGNYDTPDRKQVISVQGSKLRMELIGGRADSYMLFDSSDDHIKMVRKDKKQYIVLSKNQVRTMKNQGNAIANDRMKEARAMMQEKMKNMSPQQRAMAEQMLKRMGGGNSAANKAAPTKKPKKKNRKAVATKRFSKVSGIRCKIYKVYTNGKQKGEVCVAKAKKLGLTKKEVNTMRRMFATMEEVRQASTAARMMPRDNKMMTLLKQVDGIPIQFTGTKNLEPKGGLLSISKKKKAGRFFKVPKSYSKFDMSAMGHRH